MTVKDKLLLMFPNINDSYPVTDVMLETGITTEGSLKSFCWELRKKDVINLRLKWGYCKRVG